MHKKFFVGALTVFSLAIIPLFVMAQTPIGWLDGVDSNGVISGWTLDPDTPAQSLQVHFYIDAPAGQGTLIGSTVANKPRPDVNQATGYPGDHGFIWRIPARFRTSSHNVYAYAIDSSGAGTNPNLSGSPKMFVGVTSIRGSFSGSPVVLSVSTQFAGAIYSLVWKGKQFINSYDHGRELQSASSFDGLGEAYNPTEGGSEDDRRSLYSTSVLNSITASKNVLETKTRMAFWKPVGNVTLSNHILKKKVTIGFQGIPNVIEHIITFQVPEARTSATFEALTGYMPFSFSKFWTYNPKTKTLAVLSDGPGEQKLPVILSTPDNAYAMGVYSPETLPHYGRWRFDIPGEEGNATTKWNVVFRKTDVGIGSYIFRCYSVIGTLSDVTSAMDKLYTHFNP
ncbi:MAG: hypothetical protein HYT94_00790 [Parcubacteria group bacterium]|nr:hypothetical protein [Parcubacteria group bacterium]